MGKLESLYLMSTMMESMSRSYERPPVKVCKRAKGNKGTYGTKCRYGGSCDGTKRCKHAIYGK